jgi:putative PIN family toxin of toxin-antitoxin system
VIRATIDTNVLVPAIRRVGQIQGSRAPIIQAWRDQLYELVISEYILEEVQNVLASPYFSRFIPAADRAAAIETFRADATIVPITVAVEGVATHPEDDLILATALSGQVDYLVTLDRQLLALHSHDGIDILTPQAFLAVLSAER